MPISKLKAGSIASGTLEDARIPSLAASKIGSGTFADARIAASNVSQHATSFDDDKLVNDLSTLGLRVHTQENLTASNTNSQYVDVFQDATGITNLTNTTRNASEYVDSTGSSSAVGSWTTDSDTKMLLSSDGVSSGSTTFTDESSTGSFTAYGGIDHRSAGGAPTGLGSNAISFNGTSDYLTHNVNYNFIGTGDYTLEFWLKTNTTSEGYIFYNADNGSTGIRLSINANGTITMNEQVSNGDSYISTSTAVNDNNWHHIALVRTSSGREIFIDGSSNVSDTVTGRNFSNTETFYVGRRGSGVYYSGYLAELRISTTARYSRGSSFTPNTVTTTAIQATGSFESNAITAPSSVSSMGAIITYQDNAGTNSLNTDIVLKLSANGGSNYATATLTTLPDFSTGIKMAKVNDLSVTAGTSLKYKIEFANQSASSKEARIRGVSLNY